MENEIRVVFNPEEAEELLLAARYKHERVISALNTTGLSDYETETFGKIKARLESCIMLLDGALVSWRQSE